MSRHLDVVNLTGDEYDRLMDEREILRKDCERAWNEVDTTAKKRDAALIALRAYRILLVAVNAMMAPLGFHGTISARDDRVQAVMDALAQVNEIDQ